MVLMRVLMMVMTVDFLDHFAVMICDDYVRILDDLSSHARHLLTIPLDSSWNTNTAYLRCPHFVAQRIGLNRPPPCGQPNLCE